MSISDWSSDVCSSDLLLKGSASKGAAHARRRDCGPNGFAHDQIFAMRLGELVAIMAGTPAGLLIHERKHGDLDQIESFGHVDRKCVVSGKSVSVRVDPGG